jgi:xylulokinase
MTEQILIYYDVGTTSVKTIIFDRNGMEIESVSIPYPTYYQHDCAEQNPDDFWQAAITGTKRLSPSVKEHIVSIGISGHMNGALFLDKQGQSVRPELIHSDTRSKEECVLIANLIPDGYPVHGNRIDEHLSLPKIFWLFRHEKESYEKTAFFINSKDFIRGKLTGVIGESDFSDASLSCAMNMRAHDWDKDLLTDLGLDPKRFPILKKSTDIGGLLTKEAASILGLKAGIPVSMGAGDAACATRGAGVKNSSTAYACLGSSAWISTLGSAIVPDTKRRLQNFFDLDGQHVNICGTVQSTGVAIDWILKTLGLERKDVEAFLDQCQPGSRGILFAPYLLGDRSPFWDSKARGSFVGLSLNQSPLDIAQSVYEGVAFALKDVMDVYVDLGFDYASLTVMGGIARSLSFMHLLSNVLDKSLTLHPFPTQGSGMGAAMAAMVGVGLYRDLDEAVDHMVFSKEHYNPEYLKTRKYAELFPIFKTIYGNEKPINDALYAYWNKEEGAR